MVNTTSTVYPLRPGHPIRLTLTIGSAGLAVTDVSVGGTLVVEGHEGDLDLDLGPSAALHGQSVRCYTTVKAAPAGTVNRGDYGLTGGAQPWEDVLREDPPDPAIDFFYADLFLYLP